MMEAAADDPSPSSIGPRPGSGAVATAAGPAGSAEPDVGGAVKTIVPAH